MEKQRNTKILSIVALLVAVVGLTVAFAAMSRTLTINGTATMQTATWDIHFENLTEAKTGKAVINTSAQIVENNGVAMSKIGDYQVTLTRPGDSVTYTFDVVNAGDINATLGSLTKTAPICTSAAAAPVEADATLVCGNLTYTLTYTNGGAEVKATDTLNGGETKNLTLKLEYNSTAETLPTNDVNITGLGIEMLYNQAD